MGDCYCIVNIVHSFNLNSKTYTDAKETCETKAKNGFKKGMAIRIVEFSYWGYKNRKIFAFKARPFRIKSG